MKREELIAKIMRECANDGEPVTLREAEEMADMELKAKGVKRYEKAETTPRKPNKVRKVDKTKKHLLGCIKTLLEGMHAEIESVQTETKITFYYAGARYSVTLTKHRPPKE